MRGLPPNLRGSIYHQTLPSSTLAFWVAIQSGRRPWGFDPNILISNRFILALPISNDRILFGKKRTGLRLSLNPTNPGSHNHLDTIVLDR